MPLVTLCHILIYSWNKTKETKLYFLLSLGDEEITICYSDFS